MNSGRINMKNNVEKKISRYKVEAHIDGKWFGNEFVFESVADANSYGCELVASGGVGKFRLKPTTDPVMLPPES
jgi:hypothetical protein